jgi:hypothetical protein
MIAGKSDDGILICEVIRTNGLQFWLDPEYLECGPPLPAD